MPAHSDTELRRIFDLVIDAPDEQREAVLLEACHGDESLIARVRAILSAAEDDRFLAEPEFASPVVPVLASATDETGAVVGPFTIVRRLGEGGFGVVYLASQSSPVRRDVALKIVKSGMDTAQVLARFAQERQALALLDHPNIARLFDAGATEHGRPYFAMEYVPGESLIAYCDQHRLSIAKRLRLFTQVCDAVHHAHQKGLIHRDLKPGNVLVATRDGEPSVKVIDFGIAKATGGKLTDRTIHTEHRQLIGTPEYMSPEQADGSLDVDTRSDVYSLGVILYELLTGTTPFDAKKLSGSSFAELQRIIREVDPPTPSTRFARVDGNVSDIAAKRDQNPSRLGTLIRGELDWIVLKALEKDRARRYQSASEFGADVDRYLRGEAVTAAPLSKAYRLRKFVRRNRTAVATTAGVMIALAIGAIAFAWQANEARRERDRAESERARAEAERVRAEAERAGAEAERDKAVVLARFLTNTLSGVSPGIARGRDSTMLKEMMDAAARRLEQGELKGSPEAEVRLRTQIGIVYRELSLVQDADRMLGPALDLARKTFKGDSELTADLLANVSLLKRDQRDLKAAETLAREGLAMSQRLTPGDYILTADLLNNLGFIQRDLGKLDEAEKLYRESLAMRQRLAPSDDRSIALLEANIGSLLWAKRDLDEAEKHLKTAVEMYDRLYGDYPVAGACLTRLAGIYQLRGDLAAAEKYASAALAMRRRLYGTDDNPDVADSLNQMGIVLLGQAKHAEAEPILARSLGVLQKSIGGDSRVLVTGMSNLATAQYFNGKLEVAEQTLRAALAMQRRLTPQDGEPAASLLMNLANNYRTRNDLDTAERYAKESVDIMTRVAKGDNAMRAETIYALAVVKLERERFDDAATLFRESIDIQRRLNKKGTATEGAATAELAYALLRSGDAAGAESTARSALDLLLRVASPTHRHTGTARLRLGQSLLERGQLDAAEAELIEAERVLALQPTASATRHKQCVLALAELFDRRDQLEPGKGFAERASHWRSATTRPTPTQPRTAPAPTTIPTGHATPR